MEPARILIKDSKFQPLSRVLSATPNRVETDNGWICYIKSSGTIICEARRMYQDGEYAVTYILKKNGFFTVTRESPKNGGTKRIVKKGFVCEKGTENPTDGVINLGGGNINTRKCYFRTKFFDDFLRDNQIGSIKNCDPNGIHLVQDGWKLVSDGDIKIVDEVDDMLRVQINDAKYVKIYKEEEEDSSVLFTQDNVFELDFGAGKII